MISWKDELMKYEQYKDTLRELEHDALVQQALAGREDHSPYFQSFVAFARNIGSLGSRLIQGFASLAKRLTEANDSAPSKPRAESIMVAREPRT
jgi:hypothetical protein